MECKHIDKITYTSRNIVFYDVWGRGGTLKKNIDKSTKILGLRGRGGTLKNTLDRSKQKTDSSRLINTMEISVSIFKFSFQKTEFFLVSYKVTVKLIV